MNEVVAAVLLFLSATREPVSLEAMVQDFLSKDVVVLGEEHDATRGHELQLTVIEALAEKTERDLVISMEMFERDVQGVLDDYLRGRIDEATFKAHARPWPNYDQHYRPIIEWAKARGHDVLAANVPRKVARRVAFQGLESLTDRRHAAREVSAPKDRYFELFRETMDGHVGMDADGALDRMYASQCLKDDTMAETIVDYLEARPYRRPIVVHLCGKFHSDHGLGTVIRLLQRRPLLQVAVMTMRAVQEVNAQAATEEFAKAHYVAIVQKEPEAASLVARFLEDEPVEVVATAEASVQVEAPIAPPSEEPVPAQAPPNPVSPAPATSTAPSGGRAAFGFMPDYEGTGGVLLGTVTPGGAAANAGLKDGDLLIAIDGTVLKDLEAYMDLMDTLKPGQKVRALVRRADAELSVEVTLGARP